MNEEENRLHDLRIELLEIEVARQKAPKSKSSLWVNPTVLAIIGATATLITGFATNQLQLYADRQLERDKLESSLILKAVDTENSDDRLSALHFLVKTGLITEKSKVEKINGLNVLEVPKIQYRSDMEQRVR